MKKDYTPLQITLTVTQQLVKVNANAECIYANGDILISKMLCNGENVYVFVPVQTEKLGEGVCVNSIKQLFEDMLIGVDTFDYIRKDRRGAIRSMAVHFLKLIEYADDVSDIWMRKILLISDK